MSVSAIDHPFTLPEGYRDSDGILHQRGVMRRATIQDELLPLKDHRVQPTAQQLLIYKLSQNVVQLGTLPEITPQVIADLSAADLDYLRDMHERIQ